MKKNVLLRIMGIVMLISVQNVIVTAGASLFGSQSSNKIDRELHEAIKGKNEKQIEELLKEANVNVNALDEDGRSSNRRLLF